MMYIDGNEKSAEIGKSLRLLGNALYLEPTEGSAEEAISEMALHLIVAGSDSNEADKGIALIRAWKDSFPPAEFARAIDNLREDYFRLFAGIGEPLAPLWRSYYVDKESLLFAEGTLEVRAMYHRYGLMLAKQNNEPDDNLGLMLIFLSFLMDLVEDCKTEEERCCIEEDERVLIGEYILPWMPKWLAKVEDNAESAFYRGTSRLVAFFATLQLERLSAPRV